MKKNPGCNTCANDCDNKMRNAYGYCPEYKSMLFSGDLPDVFKRLFE